MSFRGHVYRQSAKGCVGGGGHPPPGGLASLRTKSAKWYSTPSLTLTIIPNMLLLSFFVIFGKVNLQQIVPWEHLSFVACKSQNGLHSEKDFLVDDGDDERNCGGQLSDGLPRPPLSPGQWLCLTFQDFLYLYFSHFFDGDAICIKVITLA